MCLRLDHVHRLREEKNYRKITNNHKIRNNKAWNIPQIKTIKNSHELRLIRPQTKYTEPKHKPSPVEPLLAWFS
jgi:hypothetical protein